MNEKIRQLAEQSGFFPVPDDTEWDWEYRAENARYERFAELIVQDCINVVEQQKAKMSYGPTFVIEDIKRHFGVKE